MVVIMPNIFLNLWVVQIKANDDIEVLTVSDPAANADPCDTILTTT